MDAGEGSNHPKAKSISAIVNVGGLMQLIIFVML